MNKTSGIALGVGLAAAVGIVGGLQFTSADAADTVNPVFKHATVTLGAATALAVPRGSCTLNRSAIALYNGTGADVFYGDSTVTNSGATKGMIIADKQTVNIEVSCNSSYTPTVYVYSVAGCSNCLTWAETR